MPGISIGAQNNGKDAFQLVGRILFSAGFLLDDSLRADFSGTLQEGLQITFGKEGRTITKMYRGTHKLVIPTHLMRNVPRYKTLYPIEVEAIWEGNTLVFDKFNPAPTALVELDYQLRIGRKLASITCTAPEKITATAPVVVPMDPRTGNLIAYKAVKALYPLLMEHLTDKQIHSRTGFSLTVIGNLRCALFGNPEIELLEKQMADIAEKLRALKAA
jgi:hypothetical protein